jgi:hypothetical protein
LSAILWRIPSQPASCRGIYLELEGSFVRKDPNGGSTMRHQIELGEPKESIRELYAAARSGTENMGWSRRSQLCCWHRQCGAWVAPAPAAGLYGMAIAAIDGDSGLASTPALSQDVAAAYASDGRPTVPTSTYGCGRWQRGRGRFA